MTFTSVLMADPVVASDDFTCERESSQPPKCSPAAEADQTASVVKSSLAGATIRVVSAKRAAPATCDGRSDEASTTIAAAAAAARSSGFTPCSQPSQLKQQPDLVWLFPSISGVQALSHPTFPSSQALTGCDVELRLNTLQSLRDKRLISKKEMKIIRTRIIASL